MKIAVLRGSLGVISYAYLIPIPAHHVEDIEDPIGVAVDTVKDGVTVSNPISLQK